jgi:hypothetical protein
MTRVRTTEGMLQGKALSSFGVLARMPGVFLDHEDKAGRRELADGGRPVARW